MLESQSRAQKAWITA